MVIDDENTSPMVCHMCVSIPGRNNNFDIAMAVCAIAAGIIGAMFGSSGLIYRTEPLAASVPVSKHVVF
jgi:hypothetical protein